jgi:hypothetical protein
MIENFCLHLVRASVIAVPQWSINFMVWLFLNQKMDHNGAFGPSL